MAVSTLDLECARLCSEVYACDEDVILRTTEAGSLIVAIEGSDTVENWMDNLSFAFRRGDVHRGFDRYARYCIHEYGLRARLAAAAGKEVCICGHSLGAAAAILIVYLMRDLLQEKSGSVRLVLFGAPQPGGADFVERFHEACDGFVRIRSYSTRHDVVPMLPLGLWGYKPIAPPLLLDTCYNRLRILSNHHMGTYIAGVEQRCRREGDEGCAAAPLLP